MMRLMFCFFAVLLSFSATAITYALPVNGSRLIGKVQWHTVTKGEYFNSIAQHYNVGFLALMEANPGIDPLLPQPGTVLKLPTQMLLPDVPYQGIVINLAELRLYYFPKEGEEVHVFPVGIGRIGRETPEMVSEIQARAVKPSWRPTPRIRQEYFEKSGKHYPDVIPPGPDNPLGEYALKLAYGRGNYLIHGTNKNFGIGMRVSAGCVRLNPDDIEWLFEKVNVGEPVRIINQAIKISFEPDGSKIIEVHSPLTGRRERTEAIIREEHDVLQFIGLESVDTHKAADALISQNGIPVKVDI